MKSNNNIKKYVSVHGFKVHHSGLPYETSGQLPCLNIIKSFPRCLLNSELTNQRFRFAVDSEPLNLEPVNSYI